MDEFGAVREALRDAPSEARVQRMWRGVEERRAGRRRSPVFAVSLALVVALAAWAGWFVRPRDAGPLCLASGEPLPSHFATGGLPGSAAFSDASRIALARDTRLDVLDASSTNVAFALRGGRVRFSVTPDGPRHWRIDSGAVQVDVIGTVFVVARTTAAVEVSVERGVVTVRGEGVPDRVQRLTAGAHLRVSVAPPVLSVGPAPRTNGTAQGASAARGLPLTDDSALAEGEPVGTATVNARTADAPSADAPSADAPSADPRAADALRSRVDRSGVHPEGSGTAHLPPIAPDPPVPQTPAADSVDALFSAADEARRAGRSSDALALLRRIVEAHPHDGRAALAAYSSAQLLLDVQRRPSEAADWYARSLAMGLPSSMREVAAARRVEALHRAGSPGVAEAARDYLSRYPDGRHRADVERWLAP